MLVLLACVYHPGFEATRLKTFVDHPKPKQTVFEIVAIFSGNQVIKKKIDCLTSSLPPKSKNIKNKIVIV